MGEDAVSQALAIQRDGRIIAAGHHCDYWRGDAFACARYLGDALPFDRCIQDESNGNIVQLNTTTGEYQFPNRAGLTVGGTGLLTRRCSLITLPHNAVDRRVTATVDTSTHRASASIQLLSQGRTFAITDRSLTNNTCACR